MNDERIARLTRRQQECLELVAQGYTSKQIGRRLGISYSTVDNHVLAATQLLGAETRAEAGRLFVSFQEDDDRQQLPRQPGALARAPSSPDDLSHGSAEQRRWFAALLPPIGGRENDLNFVQRTSAIARIVLFSVLVFIVCIMIVMRGLQAVH